MTMDNRPIEFREIRTLQEEGIEGGIWVDQTRIGISPSGERWIIKFTTGEESDEVVVYHLAQAFFDGIVPETHLISLEGKVASAQRMVSGKSAHDLEAEGILLEEVRNSKAMRDLANMVLLDYIIGNPDRHGNNWFIMENGHIAAIDNGFAAEEIDMPIQRALRPVYKSLLTDDCASTPTLIAIMRGIIAKVDQQALKAETVCLKYSTAKTHALIGRWQERVDKFKLRISDWESELREHCNAPMG